jgi:Holliday junction resolvasome RuvABC endonuclease subunit
MQARFVGIDPSLSRTGMCAIFPDGNVIVQSKTGSSKLPVFERQLVMLSAARKFVEKNDVVVMEDFGVSARFAASGRFIERIELCGMLKMILTRVSGLPMLSAQPTLLKAFITGKAGADKTAVIDAVRTVWKVDVSNDDEADAFGLAALAKAFFDNDKRFEKSVTKFKKYGSNSASIRKINFVS